MRGTRTVLTLTITLGLEITDLWKGLVTTAFTGLKKKKKGRRVKSEERRQDKTGKDETRQGKTNRDEKRQGKIKHDKTRQAEMR